MMNCRTASMSCMLGSVVSRVDSVVDSAQLWTQLWTMVVEVVRMLATRAARVIYLHSISPPVSYTHLTLPTIYSV